MDLEELEMKIINIGGQLVAYEDQINTIIDSEEDYIQKDLDSYLRIRETNSLLDDSEEIEFTLKQNIQRDGIRENIERNIVISDKDEMLQVLDVLGYSVKAVGIKRRKSYQLDDIRFDLDKWDENTYPYPYMEIEVIKESDLDYIIKVLNIPKENISTKSITGLREELKRS